LSEAAQTLLAAQDASGFVFENARGKAIDAGRLANALLGASVPTQPLSLRC
jgi:hypothetical protein